MDDHFQAQGQIAKLKCFGKDGGKAAHGRSWDAPVIDKITLSIIAAILNLSYPNVKAESALLGQ